MRVYRLDGPLSNGRLHQLMEREMFPSPCLDYSRHCWRDGHGEDDLYEGEGIKFYFRSYKMALKYLMMLRDEYQKSIEYVKEDPNSCGVLEGFMGYKLTRHHIRGKDIVYLDDCQVAVGQAKDAQDTLNTHTPREKHTAPPPSLVPRSLGSAPTPWGPRLRSLRSLRGRSAPLHVTWD